MKQVSLFENDQADLLDILRASELLGVSTATVRNWIKTGQLAYSPMGSGKLLEKKQIEQLKTDIHNGKTERLNNRANKRNSKSTFIPIEQLSHKDKLPLLQSYIEQINKNQVPLQTALLIHSLSVLKKTKLATFDKFVSTLSEVKFKNNNIKKVILEWEEKLGKINLSDLQELLNVDDVFSFDSLGVLYQSLLDEGKKSQGGSYYTPKTLIDGIVEDLSSQIKKGSKVLDPCCGTGQFLVAFSRYIPDPLLLWGYDIDPIAVQIAKINLITTYPEIDFYPNMFVANSLTENPDGRFDIIATNPPWGYHFSKEESEMLRKVYPNIISNEAFSYFLVRGLSLLNDNGSLCYVLPEAVTKVKQHRDVRDFLLRGSAIKSIKHLGNVFSKVLSPVITLTIQKRSDAQNEIEVTQKDGLVSKIKQNRFINNSDFAFDTSITEKDELLIAKIYKHSFTTLKDNADWALGIVTGNNGKFISTTKTDNNEGVLKGSDIQKYTFNPATSFIKFTPDEFQQVAPVWKYRAKEKLIYKFISSELAFAYDYKQTLTLNSANILIPKIPEIPTKVVLVFLNSNIFQYLWKKKFNTVKVLRGDLELLPFPQIDDKTLAEIEKDVDNLLSGTQKDKLEDKLNEFVFDAFGLTTDEKQYIKNSIRK
ncbi:MAG TPA: N-6 DNA methylase [Candidatus Woesebacteria bacterium]|nr:N-6 DNA methylase [Candidatus Woesebacteria bacterium]